MKNGELLLLAEIVFGLLSVVLFFKVWGMTNDVERIKKILEKAYENKNNKFNKSDGNVDDEQSDGNKRSSYGTGYKVGDKVTSKSHNGIMEVIDIYEDGSISCIDVESGEIVGVFNKKDLTKKK